MRMKKVQKCKMGRPVTGKFKMARSLALKRVRERESNHKLLEVTLLTTQQQIIWIKYKEKVINTSKSIVTLSEMSIIRQTSCNSKWMRFATNTRI